MAIKLPLEYSQGQPKVHSFPKVQYAKIKELIEAVNGITDGTYSFDALTVTALSTNKVTVSASTATISGTTATLDKAAGVLTTPALTTAGGSTSAAYTITNSFVVAGSTILLTPLYASGKTGNPIAILESIGTGSFVIKVGNGAPAATALNDVVKIHFLIV